MMDEKDLPDDPHKAHGVLIRKINEHTEKMHRLDEKLDDVISENRAQNEKLDRIEKNTAGLVNAFEAGKGTVKVGKWIGGLLIFLCSVGTAIVSFWDAIVHVIEKGG